MARFLLVLCFLALFSVDSHAKIIRVIDVEEGDVSSLRSEIVTANNLAETHITTLKLYGNYVFGPQDVMPEIQATISLRGPARLIGGGSDNASNSGDSDGPSRVFKIATVGEFRLDSLELADFSLNHEGTGLIVNYGSLHLQEIQVSNTKTNHWCVKWCTPVMPFIGNMHGGSLRVYRASMVNSGIVSGSNWEWLTGMIHNQGDALIVNSQIYLEKWGWSRSISNSGTMEIHGSSFMFRDGGSGVIPPLFGNDEPGKIKVLNSVVSGFSGTACLQASSVGYNLNDAADCEWSSTNDLTGISAGLIWRKVSANWMYSDDQILEYAIVPMAASPAVDSANDKWCVSESLLADGRIRGDGCDRGAVETRKTTLGEGGINGLFFNPDADGHYLQILQTDYLTLVIWNTFDLDGNHVWVYGTGQLVDGKSVIAETYINHDVILLPGASVPDAETDYWGTLEVEMTSCGTGFVSFNSVNPDFGSGQFPIERLAYIKQLGCTD